MQPDERLEALALADAESVIRLADEVLTTLDVTVTRGPTVGVLMVRVEEPGGRSGFNFTEVVVSEAEVAADGARGYAMVMGRSPERALAAAVLDVAAETGHTLGPAIDTLMSAALRADAEGWRARWREVAPTRVTFEEVTT